MGNERSGASASESERKGERNGNSSINKYKMCIKHVYSHTFITHISHKRTPCPKWKMIEKLAFGYVRMNVRRYVCVCVIYRKMWSYFSVVRSFVGCGGSAVRRTWRIHSARKKNIEFLIYDVVPIVCCTHHIWMEEEKQQQQLRNWWR